jgi:hypothetical protein
MVLPTGLGSSAPRVTLPDNSTGITHDPVRPAATTGGRSSLASPDLPPRGVASPRSLAPAGNLVAPTGGGHLQHVAALRTQSATPQTPEHRTWVDRFNNEWKSRVSHELHDRFNNPEVDRRLETLRSRIGPEWAKDNGVRRIDTNDLKRWMGEMKNVRTADDCVAVLQRIEREVDQRLR